MGVIIMLMLLYGAAIQQGNSNHHKVSIGGIVDGPIMTVHDYMYNEK